MTTAPIEKLIVKNRIVGALIKEARKDAGYSKKDCAAFLGIDKEIYKGFEIGRQAPTLPQLEILAYLFDVPIAHFWEGKSLSEKRKTKEIADRVGELLMLRQRIIGVRIRQLREKAGLTIEQVAQRTGHDVRQISSLESGRVALPVHELDLVADAVNARLEDLLDRHGEVGEWLASQGEYEQFKELPSDLRSFLVKPINRSYIELAQKMSEMEVDRLRAIAESILEITY